MQVIVRFFFRFFSHYPDSMDKTLCKSNFEKKSNFFREHRFQKNPVENRIKSGNIDLFL